MEKKATLDKDDKLATALKRLGDQRMDTLRFGKERYETFWGDDDDLRNRDPGGYGAAVEFAASVVRECFGTQRQNIS